MVCIRARLERSRAVRGLDRSGVSRSVFELEIAKDYAEGGTVDPRVSSFAREFPLSFFRSALAHTAR